MANIKEHEMMLQRDSEHSAGKMAAREFPPGEPRLLLSSRICVQLES